MSFVVFTVLSFVILRLSIRARFQTLLWLSVVLGLLVDLAVDFLIRWR